MKHYRIDFADLSSMHEKQLPGIYNHINLVLVWQNKHLTNK